MYHLTPFQETQVARQEHVASYLPTHMQQHALEYILYGVPGGGFLKAVLENNLSLAASRADDINLVSLHTWARWLNNIPMQAWGSPERVRAWQRQNGLLQQNPPSDI